MDTNTSGNAAADELDENVRVAVYRAFATRGTPPAPAELAEVAGGSLAVAKQALHRLAEAHHLVLNESEHIVMAHPFASMPLGFSVMGRRTLWWGGCAWDSFAVPHLVDDEPEVLVATRCPGCGKSHSWVVGRDAPPSGAQLAHFLVPARRMWDDVVHTCGHQRIFCARSCVDSWLAATGNTAGYVMDLATLWNLAAHWYEGRLDHGYRRREPETAAEYFAAAGLRGPFWDH